MLDFFKIDFFKTISFGDSNISQRPSQSSRFDDFLQNQLKSLSDIEEKCSTPDKSQIESMSDIEERYSTPDKVQNADKKINDTDAKPVKAEEYNKSKETKLEKQVDKVKEAKKDDSIEKNEPGTDIKKDRRADKDEKAIGADKLLTAGKEETQKSKNEPDGNAAAENMSLLKAVSLLLNMMRGMPDKGEDVKLLKSSLNEIKNSLIGNTEDFKKNKLHLKRLFSEVRSMLNNLEKELQNLNPSDARRGLMLSNLRKQSERIAEALKKYTGKEGDIPVSDGKGKDSIIETKANINTTPGGMLHNDKKENSYSRDNDSGIGFQFSRKEAVLNRDNSGSIQRKSGDFSEYINKIIQNARIVVKDSRNGSFSLRLYPESLGRVNVNLSLEQGVILGKFLVDSAEARESLLENMAIVKQELEENGISVGEFQVNVRDERENVSSHNEGGIFAPVLGRDNAVSVSNEYEQNAGSSHDGAIDMII